jgi:Leucine-rich repeat (LRR) protein
LRGLERLRSLTLSHNALRGSGIGELGRLNALTKLSLISNPLEIRSWEGLSGRLRVLV